MKSKKHTLVIEIFLHEKIFHFVRRCPSFVFLFYVAFKSAFVIRFGNLTIFDAILLPAATHYQMTVFTKKILFTKKIMQMIAASAK